MTEKDVRETVRSVLQENQVSMRTAITLIKNTQVVSVGRVADDEIMLGLADGTDLSLVADNGQIKALVI